MHNFILESLALYLYKTLIIPIFTYCDFIYDRTSLGNKHRLQVAQNCLLRAVKQVKMDYPVKRLHDDLKIDYLNVAREKSVIKMVYRGYHEIGPPILNELFKKACPGTITQIRG